MWHYGFKKPNIMSWQDILWFFKVSFYPIQAGSLFLKSNSMHLSFFMSLAWAILAPLSWA